MSATGIGEVADLAKTFVERFWPDKSEQEKAAIAGEVQGMLGQLEINKVEAKSTMWFVAGWRPFIGWTCGVAFAYSYVVMPFLQFLAYLFGSAETVAQLQQLPRLDLAAMLPLLGGMLGLGGFRTVEKVKGAEANR